MITRNDIEIYSTHNGGKSVVAERFIRTLRNRIYKYMTLLSKNVYIDKFTDIVNKYNNAYHSTIKMKPIYITSCTHIDFGAGNNDKDPKFKVGGQVWKSKRKNIFGEDTF